MRFPKEGGFDGETSLSRNQDSWRRICLSLIKIKIKRLPFSFIPVGAETCPRFVCDHIWAKKKGRSKAGLGDKPEPPCLQDISKASVGNIPSFFFFFLSFFASANNGQFVSRVDRGVVGGVAQHPALISCKSKEGGMGSLFLAGAQVDNDNVSTTIRLLL
ncbi:hypothetical protein LX36DRAFT_74210 [Colletotrichum falcatum]|nr:hypothetical protein LX36DRAFT_74210 [Colletotrichum falcatum]